MSRLTPGTWCQLPHAAIPLLSQCKRAASATVYMLLASCAPHDKRPAQLLKHLKSFGAVSRRSLFRALDELTAVGLIQKINGGRYVVSELDSLALSELLDSSKSASTVTGGDSAGTVECHSWHTQPTDTLQPDKNQTDSQAREPTRDESDSDSVPNLEEEYPAREENTVRRFERVYREELGRSLPGHQIPSSDWWELEESISELHPVTQERIIRRWCNLETRDGKPGKIAVNVDYRPKFLATNWRFVAGLIAWPEEEKARQPANPRGDRGGRKSQSPRDIARSNNRGDNTHGARKSTGIDLKSHPSESMAGVDELFAYMEERTTH